MQQMFGSVLPSNFKPVKTLLSRERTSIRVSVVKSSPSSDRKGSSVVV
jgi:hypothetical protein